MSPSVCRVPCELGDSSSRPANAAVAETSSQISPPLPGSLPYKIIRGGFLRGYGKLVAGPWAYPIRTSLFRDDDVDAEVVLRLTADDLRELGVTSIGHRRRLLDPSPR